MKSLKAERIRIRIGDIWESPELHVLLTQENDVVVARCLDFTVSSHGENIKDALNSLLNSPKFCAVMRLRALHQPRAFCSLT